LFHIELFLIKNLYPCSFINTTVEECLVAYLSFDVVDLRKKTVYDEGPYGNDFTYNGDVKFLPANYSCQNAASIDSDGDLYYSGSGFTNSPESGTTIAMWVHPSDLLHKQSIFTSKTIGSKGGSMARICVVFFFVEVNFSRSQTNFSTSSNVELSEGKKRLKVKDYPPWLLYWYYDNIHFSIRTSNSGWNFS